MILSSTVCVCMVAFRIYLTGQLTLAWLIWPNLVLAWIPLVMAVLLHQRYSAGERRLLPLGALGLLWLLFFPNAPYIVTDLVHLQWIRGPVPIYYDIAVIALTALTGLYVGFVSLYLLQSLWRRVFGAPSSWLFALGALALSSVGIYLGRVLRWHSFHAFLRPAKIMADAAKAVADPGARLFVAGYILVLCVMYLLFYQTASLREQVDRL